MYSAMQLKISLVRQREEIVTPLSQWVCNKTHWLEPMKFLRIRDSLQIIYRQKDKAAEKVCQGILKKISRGIFFKKGRKIGEKTSKKRKKTQQKFQKRGKKEKNEEKLKKMIRFIVCFL